MKLNFFKYQGTGNDFIIIDDRSEKIQLTKNQIQKICKRYFSIGADGLIMLRKKKGYDFEMIYYNSDGNLGSMCGNGGRCIVAFSNFIGNTNKKEVFFWAADGEHQAIINDDNVLLKMNDVKEIESKKNNYYLNTGSPHYVSFVKHLNLIDVWNKGRKIRYNTRFYKEGTNVNFVQIIGNNNLMVKTYERGVEDETLSCGTGVTASALAYAELHKKKKGTVNILTSGGKLKVTFQKKGDGYTDIFLEGPAELTFSGEITI